MVKYYESSYFEGGIFANDYKRMASIIFDYYKPKKVLEVGCGKGQLAKELNSKGISVTAIDGFANPDFEGNAQIQFHKVDLNAQDAASEFFEALESRFDLVISMEVAEHLDPKVNPALVQWLTNSADIVIFSAAVQGQGGDGHINCQPRQYWCNLFESHGYQVQDKLRAEFRKHPSIKPWYQLNVLSFSKNQKDWGSTLVKDLIASDSFASSMYYQKCIEYDRLAMIINLPAVASFLKIRNFISRLLGRRTLRY